MATIIVKTASELSNALGSAKATDQIRLMPGSWARLTIRGLVAPEPGITIASASGQKGDCFVDGLDLSDCANLRLSGFKLGSWNPVVRCQNVLISDMEVAGDPALFANPSALGFQLTDNDGVTLSNCRFDYLGWCVQVQTCRNTKLLRLDVQHTRGDGLRNFSGCTNIEIGFCRFRNFYQEDAAHRDVIQAWPGAVRADGSAGIQGLHIHDNFYDLGETQGAMQYLFLGNDGSGGYDGCVIERNAGIGASYHGITAPALSNSRVSDNFIQGRADGFNSWLTLTDGEHGNITERNRSSGNGDSDDPSDPNRPFIEIPMAANGQDYAEFNKWVAGEQTDPVPPDPEPPDPCEDEKALLRQHLTGALHLLAGIQHKLADCEDHHRRRR